MTTRELHKESSSRLYSIWQNMKNRCYGKAKLKERDSYKNLDVFPSWRYSFINFKRWAESNGYKDSLSIDRIDNSLGYFPDNCRWADVTTQNQNQRVLKSHNTSGFRGVYFYKSRAKAWWAYISIDSKRKSLGYFYSPYEAAVAYNNYVKLNNLEHPLNTLHQESFIHYGESLGKLAGSLNSPDVHENIAKCMRDLKYMAELRGHTLVDCLQVAWDDIKDRRGKMVDGVFLKEEDITLGSPYPDIPMDATHVNSDGQFLKFGDKFWKVFVDHEWKVMSGEPIGELIDLNE